LANKLTGYNIDVIRDSDEGDEDDVALEEFADEIANEIIQKLKEIGCDTAKSVLKKGEDFIERQTGLDKATVQYVFQILKSEFEED
jgi:N utilization substance protein A